MTTKDVRGKLVHLLTTNPELPIMAVVSWDVVGGDEFAYWYGNVIAVDVENVWNDGAGRTWTRTEAEDEPSFFYEFYGDGKITDDKEMEQAGMDLIEGLPWKKVILVYVDTMDD